MLRGPSDNLWGETMSDRRDPGDLERLVCCSRARIDIASLCIVTGREAALETAVRQTPGSGAAMS